MPLGFYMLSFFHMYSLLAFQWSTHTNGQTLQDWGHLPGKHINPLFAGYFIWTLNLVQRYSWTTIRHCSLQRYRSLASLLRLRYQHWYFPSAAITNHADVSELNHLGYSNKTYHYEINQLHPTIYSCKQISTTYTHDILTHVELH